MNRMPAWSLRVPPETSWPRVGIGPFDPLAGDARPDRCQISCNRRYRYFRHITQEIEHRDEGWLQSALYPLLDALGSRNLIEGRRKSAVQGRMLEVSLGAGTPLAFRLMVCLPVVASTSVLQTVSALSFLMVRLLWICERLRRSCGSVGTAAHLERPSGLWQPEDAATHRIFVRYATLEH